jgi:hypothetical protein
MAPANHRLSPRSGLGRAMRIIVDASGTVLMYSDMDQPTPDVGQTAIDLASDLATAFLKVIDTAPYGLTFDGENFAPIAAHVVPPPVLTVDQKLSQIGLSVALLAPAIQAVIQAVPAAPAQQDAPT